MYAITFDLLQSDLREHYHSQPPNAYVEIKSILKRYGFEWVQGSVYVQTGQEGQNLPRLYEAIDHLKKLSWFSKSVRDIRVFRIEEWSDFTQLIKTE